MANPHRGAVALEAGEKVYSLRFTTNSICELEDHLDMPIMQAIDEMQDDTRVSMRMIRSMVWGALVDEHSDITVTDAGRLLDTVGMEVMTEKLGLALQRFFPDQEGEGNENPPKAPAKK